MTKETAIALLNNLRAFSEDDDEPAIDMAIEALENERPKGHWDFAGDNMFRCTECGVLYTYKQLEHLKKHTTDSTFPNFCPTCGADMRGERNDDK